MGPPHLPLYLMFLIASDILRFTEQYHRLYETSICPGRTDTYLIFTYRAPPAVKSKKAHNIRAFSDPRTSTLTCAYRLPPSPFVTVAHPLSSPIPNSLITSPFAQAYAFTILYRSTSACECTRHNLPHAHAINVRYRSTSTETARSIRISFLSIAKFCPPQSHKDRADT